MHVFHTLVPFFLCTMENAVFYVLNLCPATNSSVLSLAPRWHGSLDETALHLLSSWNDHRPCQREVRTACRKCVLATAAYCPASTSQKASLREDRQVPLVATYKDASDLEIGPLHYPTRDAAARAAWALPCVLETQIQVDLRRPKLSPETIVLIKEMVANNRLWGAERIRGEFLKLGIRVSQTDHSEIYEASSPTSSPWAELEDLPAQSCGRGVGGVGLRFPSDPRYLLSLTFCFLHHRIAHYQR